MNEIEYQEIFTKSEVLVNSVDYVLKAKKEKMAHHASAKKRIRQNMDGIWENQK